MKDYSLGKNKNFILNYRIENDSIIVNLANKEKMRLPYNRKNEIDVLRNMKKQVINCKCENKLANKKENELQKLKISSIISIIITSLLLATNLSFTIGAIIYSALGVNVILAISCFIKVNKFNRLISDIKKNKLFVGNEIIINSCKKENDKNLTINDVDNISYTKINTIIKNKKRVLRKNNVNY